MMENLTPKEAMQRFVEGGDEKRLQMIYALLLAMWDKLEGLPTVINVMK